jgi:hypothetical protein
MYTLKRLLTECSKRKWRTKRVAKNLPDDKMKVMEECWSALNLWILASMEKGKGANIPNFGRFEWEIFYDFTGKKVVKMRPNFVLADSFCRAYGAKNWKTKAIQNPTTPLDLNFTEIAIRWSAILTKDAAFCGLRDIFQRLGQVISSGRACKIRFGCGKFLVKEKKVAFVFDPDIEVKKQIQGQLARASPSMNKFSVTNDSEILELLDAVSDAGSYRAGSIMSACSSRYGSNEFVPLPPMSPAVSFRGASAEEARNKAEEAQSGVVPKLDLGSARMDQLSARIEAVEVVEGADKPVVDSTDAQAYAGAGSGKPPLSIKKGEDTKERSSTKDLSRASKLSARRGLKLIEEEYNDFAEAPQNPETSNQMSAAGETGMIFAVSSKYKNGVFGKEDGRGDRNAQRKVMLQAYERHMEQTEGKIDEEEQDAQDFRDQLWAREIEYRSEMKKRREELADLTRFLGKQIEYNEKIRNDEKSKNLPVKAYPDLHRFQKLARKYGLKGKLRPLSASSQLGSARSLRSTDSVDSKYMLRMRDQQLGLILRRQIEDKMASMQHQRDSELNDGRRFIAHVNAAAQEQRRKMLFERNQVRNDLREAWDRAANVKEMIAARRKKMKKGGIVFDRNGNVVEGGSFRSKNSSSNWFSGGGSSSRGSSRRSQSQSALPEVPKDISVGFDMRSAR